MNSITESFISFFNRIERDTGKKGITSITVSDRLFDPLWHENQNRIVALDTKSAIIINELWLYDVHIVRETPRVIEKGDHGK